ncbi:hypothetical protein GQ53DRAFT_87970 [Thozetella sp. PMI_491]|nr:hypothetical protein GQ53DRAFT_87970 [Thozetella sp. PMI_491]
MLRGRPRWCRGRAPLPVVFCCVFARGGRARLEREEEWGRLETMRHSVCRVLQPRISSRSGINEKLYREMSRMTKGLVPTREKLPCPLPVQRQASWRQERDGVCFFGAKFIGVTAVGRDDALGTPSRLAIWARFTYCVAADRP